MTKNVKYVLKIHSHPNQKQYIGVKKMKKVQDVIENVRVKKYILNANNVISSSKKK